VQLSYILDCVDGRLARLKKTSSSFGKWLDNILDGFGDFLIVSGIAFGLFTRFLNFDMLIIGFFALLSVYMMRIISQTTENVFMDTREEINKSSINRLSKKLRLKPNFIGFTIDLRYFLILIFALINQLVGALVLMAIIGNIQWMVVLLLIARRGNRKSS